MKYLFTFLIILMPLLVHAQTKIEIVTNKGTMRGILYEDTPLHTENFIELIKKKHYDGVLFHRVINDFMIQTGDPKSKNAPKGATLGTGDVGYTIPAEFKTHYIHKKGALAAARQGDQYNPQKRSSGSQFYIVEGTPVSEAQLKAIQQKYHQIPYSEEQKETYLTKGGTPHLDFNYTVFGEITEGLDVIDNIASVPVDGANRPLEDVKVISIRIIE